MSSMQAHRQVGFTLLELMITMVILVILMTLAVPGFQGFQRSSAVSSAASSFVAAMNSARAEAIQRAKPTLVVPTAGGTDWSAGWTVFVDMNNNGTYDSGDVLLLQQGALPASVTVPVSSDAPGFVDGSVAYVKYDNYGIPRSKTSGALPLPNGIDFSATSGSQTTKRRVILGVVGRALTCDPTKTMPVCTITMD